MRIIAGKKRGLKLDAPIGNTTRPTMDRTREDILNIITNTDLKKYLKNQMVADVFAGSGSVGLEMVSRGAFGCTFYESDTTALKVLKSNCKKTEFDNLNIEYNAIKPKSKKAYSLVFMDAPYNQNLSQKAVDAFFANNLINDDTLLIIQVAKDEELPEINNFEIIKNRIMGGGKVAFYLSK